MGKRAKRDRARSRLATAPSSRPPPGTSSVGFANWLGHYGIILVLFETPSGFALMHYDGVKLFRPKALENIWSEFINMDTAQNVVFLQKFEIFEDKASAIKSDGVCFKLAKMIRRSLWPGQKLAVGKQEYKDIIEASLGIHCLFDEAVLEVMWGLKNLINVLLPDEKLVLTNEDRLQISRGMKSVLDRYGIKIDANLVNAGIIDMASTLYECDLFEYERDPLLEYGSKQLQKASGLDSKDWDRLKLATALKLICYPEDEIETGDSAEMLSESEAGLVVQAHCNGHKLRDWIYLDLYKEIAWAHGVRRRALEQLAHMVEEAPEGSMVEEAKEKLKLRGVGCGWTET
ncbi:hypothetical protein QYE76_059618 [Lolium multiflorum]|uniref:Nucleolar protein 58/56 N-terminal domain-containing protein n=1 Tax=Lolium multiflorum TaxID=4521 RepID=A0AAD8RYX8_LOLMU|nr:hypothetical protein QYE76_059618 [Lolium multiflorum]